MALSMGQKNPLQAPPVAPKREYCIFMPVVINAGTTYPGRTVHLLSHAAIFKFSLTGSGNLQDSKALLGCGSATRRWCLGACDRLATPDLV
jgi:hypothetical protein